MTGRKTILSLIAVTILILSATAVFTTLQKSPEPEPIQSEPEPVVEVEDEQPFTTNIIGQSVAGRDISVTTFGNGPKNILFVGGIHGGYEWNSSLLAYRMIEHLTAKPYLVPDDISVSIIPDLNPDGTTSVTGVEGKFSIENITDPDTRVAEGRFNQNGIDLNRNFDCKWAPESTWRGNVVSAGSEAFSEPEAQALRGFVNNVQPVAVVFWHSQAGNVYASECEEGVLPDTLVLMELYAEAGDYGQVPVFDAYPITGDAEGWLASIGIPAVTVELDTYNSIEWERNLNGFLATVGHYTETEYFGL